MKFGKCMLAGVVLTLAMAPPAPAQTPPSNQTPVAPKTEGVDSMKCAPSDLPSGTTGQGTPSVENRAGKEDLSDKLARSNGVICPPPHTDTEINAPTPPGGKMPVIPPPGSPGGNQNVQPK